MSVRPYVLLSCAVSLDGCLDDASDERLLLSNDEDFARVDALRASCDTILVGATTIRRDDPRLLVRSDVTRSPTKVTLTSSGDLDPAAQFFTAGDVAKLVYAASDVVDKTRARLGTLATVVDGGDPLDLRQVLADLAARSVERLMVEGGAHVLSQFLAEGLADELQIAIAPIMIGDPNAPKFAPEATQNVGNGASFGKRRLRLVDVRQLGDVVVLRYLLEPRDRRWLGYAIDLSRLCPPVATAFNVGAVIVGEDDEVIATGYSREADPKDHAEEAALAKVPLGDPRLATATLYSSLEPCSKRASRPRTCSELILAAGIPRVVFAWREPAVFVDCEGAEILRAGGVEVVELPDLAEEVRALNAHLL